MSATSLKTESLLVPINEAFYKSISMWRKIGLENKFTTDGIHLSPEGRFLALLTLAGAWRLL